MLEYGKEIHGNRINNMVMETKSNVMGLEDVTNSKAGEKTLGTIVVDGFKHKWQPLGQDVASNNDPVNHPKHYGGDTTYETIKVIEAWKLGFALGNAVKYISRAQHKGKLIEDLLKAEFYIKREIENARKAIKAADHY